MIIGPSDLGRPTVGEAMPHPPTVYAPCALSATTSVSVLTHKGF
jgi:hypothetical protein